MNSSELKQLFREVVYTTTLQCGRRDWAILRWRNEAPFNKFTLIELMLN